MDYIGICQHLNRMIQRALERGESEFAYKLMDARATFGYHQTLQDREGFQK